MAGHELLTVEQMGEADRRAVALGVPSLTLMENAGRAVADAAWQYLNRGDRVAVLCGPGNNGGDGFVAARHLKERGCEVTVALLGERDALKGDAAEMAARWHGAIIDVECEAYAHLHSDLIVDALFGAGLSRAIDPESALADVIASQNACDGPPIIAVDVPSGLDGTTGQPMGQVLRATETVTFFRLKPGHLLLPGRVLCGRVTLADIGIPSSALAGIASTLAVSNSADAFYHWLGYLPRPRLDGHKYARGHAVVVSGPPHATGAARMGARGALRAGAGLVTMASPPSALPENAAHLTAIMLQPCADAHALSEILKDARRNAVLIGPGAGVGVQTGEMVLAALGSGAGVVLDADALTSFAEIPDREGEVSGVGFGFTTKSASRVHTPRALFDAIRANPARSVVLTPHDGEFNRLFPDLAGMPSKLDRARYAAGVSGAVVILKGPDTVIASPDGRAAINDNAPPWLATAGSGDVLAGFVTGLLAQGMAAFEAACAAVWMHGECANMVGPGLIAEDLPEALPQVLRALYSRHEQGA